MIFRTSEIRLATAVLFAIVVAPALAQEAEQPQRNYSSLLSPAAVDAMIDNYARALARKYNLTPEQDEFTQQYLRVKANEFLERHRDKLAELMGKLVEVRSGGEIDQQGLIAWGKSALPLYEEAKLLIVAGNNDWRQILTEDQAKIHDADLKQMYEGFATTEDQLHRMVSGQMTVEEFRRGQPLRPGPGQNPSAAAPGQPATVPPARPRPMTQVSPPKGGTVTAVPGQSPRDGRNPHPPGPWATGAGGGEGRVRTFNGGGHATSQPDHSGLDKLRALKARGAAGVVGKDFESQWEAYVREFIQKYRLNDAQAEKARSILKDCQEQGRQYMARHKAELDDFDKKVLALGQSKEKDKAKELADLNQRRSKLLEPIGRIFEQQLKPRLEKLPTTAQRAAAEAASKHNGATGPGHDGKGRTPPGPTPPPEPPPPEDPNGGP